MIRGVQKKVIVVQSPDPAVFEQAIFIVRDEAAAGGRVEQEQMLRLARKTASACLEGAVATKIRTGVLRRFPRTVCVACAAAAAAVAGLAALIAGI